MVKIIIIAKMIIMIITVIVLMIMMILIIKMNAQTRIMIFQINLENKIFPYSYYVFSC